MRHNRLFTLYNHLEEVILVIFFGAMVLIIFLQVVMRYGFNNSLAWSEEVGRFAFEWLTWIGISIGAREGQHIKITLLTDKFPFRVAQMVNILSELIIITICLLTLLYGIEISRLFAGSNFTTMKISLAWGYASVIVGCGLMVLRSLASLVNSARNIRSVKGNPPVLTSQEERS